jgi:multidrug resistance efflux pump
MKCRFRTIQLTALVLVVLLTAGCQDKATPTATATTPTPSASLSVPYGAAAADRITALGTIRPAQTLQLGFGASGPVHTVPVRLGTEVKEGDLLATLDTAALELELQSTQQEVALRQAALDGLISGSSATLVARAEAEHAQQVAQAEIALRVAQWELDEAEEGLERQVAQAGLNLASAQARLTQAEEANADAITQAKWMLQIAQVNVEEARKANERQLAEVQRTLEVAQIGLAQLQEEPDAVEIELLRLSWERAKNNLWSAQLERDAVKGQAGTAGHIRGQAEAAVGNAEIAVREAELRHQQALQPVVAEDDIRLRQIEVEEAKATLEQLQEGVDPSLAIKVEQAQQELARLKKGVDPLLSIGIQQAKQELARLKKGADPLLPIGVQQAQQELDWLKEDMASVPADEVNQPQPDGTLAALEAEVELAQLQLDALQAWENPYLDPAPPEEIAQTEARLRQAELSVAQLELQLQGAELRAPFDGAISAVYLHPGEWGGPGVQVVEIIDTTRWYVETRNVSELTIGQVQVGQEAEVQVLALRGETLRGRVATISPVAVVQQGDTTYTLMIELEPTDLNLRPGMNAQVEILLE